MTVLTLLASSGNSFNKFKSLPIKKIENEKQSKASSQIHDTFTFGAPQTPPLKPIQNNPTYRPLSTDKRKEVVSMLTASNNPVMKTLATELSVSPHVVAEIQKQLKFFSQADVIAGNTKPTQEHIEAVLAKLREGKDPIDIHKDSPLTLREVKKLKENSDAPIRDRQITSRSENQSKNQLCDRLISNAVVTHEITEPEKANTTFPYAKISQETGLLVYEIYERALQMEEAILEMGITDSLPLASGMQLQEELDQSLKNRSIRARLLEWWRGDQ